MIGAVDGKVYDVSPTCELIERWNDPMRPDDFCGKPTTHFYPAHGGGTMALCSKHAEQHGRNAWPTN